MVKRIYLVNNLKLSENYIQLMGLKVLFDYAKAKDDVPNGVWGQVYEDLKAQALAWDLELVDRFKQHKQTEVNEQICKSMDTNGLIKHIEPQDEAVRKKMYNSYIHWSSQLETKGLISQYA